MTVTSGKDVCRKIGHSDEVDGENQENTYIDVYKRQGLCTLPSEKSRDTG